MGGNLYADIREHVVGMGIVTTGKYRYARTQAAGARKISPIMN